MEVRYPQHWLGIGHLWGVQGDGTTGGLETAGLCYPGRDMRLVPAQDVHFFYTRSHLSALQNCALLFSTNFQFIFIFKKCMTQFSH